MMEYLFIIIVAIVQALGYWWLDKNSIRFPKWILLLTLLVGQLLIFPQLLFSALGYGQNGCGMPIFGLLFICVALGGSMNILVHLFFHFNYRRKNAS